MFNKDFYPTPKGLAEKMLKGVKWECVQTILEPSAGKGDLVEAIMDLCNLRSRSRWGTEHKLDIDCIEIEPDLRSILGGKGYKVVHDDFLSYHTFKQYDMIISNPPFSQGAKHLMKMLEMQKNGGSVICLLNAETLLNPYTAERKVLASKLKDYGAEIEYVQGAFLDAERKTPIEVAIVKVFIPETEKTSFIFDDTLKKAENMGYRDNVDESQFNELAENDLIKAIVKQYEIEAEAGIRLIDEFQALSSKIKKGFNEEGSKKNMLALTFNGYVDRGYVKGVTHNTFLERVRAKYWEALFQNPKFTGKLTKDLKDKWNSQIERLAEYDFSTYNIYTIREEMSKSVVKGVEDAIISLFDELSHKYAYWDTSKNIHYYNGWCTNKSWYINRRVIIPLSGWSEWAGYYNPTDYHIVEKLADIEKVFDYLDGGLTDNLDLRAALADAKNTLQTSKIPLKYFNVTFYKKGTCHIEFKNEELLKKFNIFGSQRKGWLPPSYGKKTYREMEPEERAVIDEFEGEAAYNKVVSNSQYYICSADQLLQIEGQ